MISDQWWKNIAYIQGTYVKDEMLKYLIDEYIFR